MNHDPEKQLREKFIQEFSGIEPLPKEARDKTGLFIFVLATNSSMNGRFDIDSTFLEAGKAFIKLVLSKKHLFEIMHVVLFTYDRSFPLRFQSRSDNDSELANFLERLKSIKAEGLNNVDYVFQQVYEFLHLYYQKNDIDPIGKARYVNLNLATYVFWITNETKIINENRILSEIPKIKMEAPGQEYLENEFNNSQKFYCIYLYDTDNLYYDNSQHGLVYHHPAPQFIQKFVENRAGYMSSVYKMSQFSQIVEGLTEKRDKNKLKAFNPALQTDFGVNIQLKERELENSVLNQNFLTIYYAQSKEKPVPPSHPLPEDFIPNEKLSEFPKRKGIVTYHFVRSRTFKIDLPHKYPVDYYYIPHCSISEELLKTNTNEQWPVFCSFPKSGNTDKRQYIPIGYLHKATSKTYIYLSILGFNYVPIFASIKSYLNIEITTGKRPIEEIEKVLTKVPYMYAICYAKILSKYLNITDLQETLVEPAYVMGTNSAIKRAKEEFENRRYGVFIKGAESQRYKPISIVKDITKVPREKILEVNQRTKIIFNGQYYYDKESSSNGMPSELSKLRNGLVYAYPSFPYKINKVAIPVRIQQEQREREHILDRNTLRDPQLSDEEWSSKPWKANSDNHYVKRKSRDKNVRRNRTYINYKARRKINQGNLPNLLSFDDLSSDTFGSQFGSTAPSTPQIQPNRTLDSTIEVESEPKFQDHLNVTTNDKVGESIELSSQNVIAKVSEHIVEDKEKVSIPSNPISINPDAEKDIDIGKTVFEKYYSIVKELENKNGLDERFVTNLVNDIFNEPLVKSSNKKLLLFKIKIVARSEGSSLEYDIDKLLKML